MEKIRSISEAFSMQPKTLGIESEEKYLNYGRPTDFCKEMKEETRRHEKNT